MITRYPELDLVNGKDELGKIPLHLACHEHHIDVVKVHIQECDNRLFTDLCKVQDSLGNTPLHYACKSDSIVKRLIDNGAEMSARNKQNEAPIHIAAKFGFIKTARILLEMGVPTDFIGGQNRTPLHYAAEHNQTRIIKLLCENER